MPKFVPPMPLVIFRQLKLPGFYPLGGTKGLYLRIRGASESYILRYQDTSGNRRSMSLGLRRSMSLSEARAKATEIRARLSEGINPTPKSMTRRQAKVHQSSKKATSASKSFADVMDLWLKYRVESNYWVNDQKEPYAITNLLARHVLPHLGNVSINAITVEDIRDVLVPIWTMKTITAKKALRNIRAILNWARAMNTAHRLKICVHFKGLSAYSWKALARMPFMERTSLRCLTNVFLRSSMHYEPMDDDVCHPNGKSHESSSSRHLG